jgi:death-on-curing protein
VTRYISLAEFVWLAEQVTGLEQAVVVKAGRLDLADSALHAPAAGFGDDDFYPDLYDKAAVLTCRLAWNHPLPDGNKRAAWACLVMFIDLNDGRWDPDPPDVDAAEAAMLAVAAHDVDEAWLAAWLQERVVFDDPV